MHKWYASSALVHDMYASDSAGGTLEPMRQFDQFIFRRHSLLTGGGRMKSTHELAELD